MAQRTMRIRAGAVEAAAVLDDSRTAQAIWEALPLSGRARRWGDEIYFSIGLSLPPEHPREVVEVGALAYWPPGQAFCVFFGPTPASVDREPRAASPVNVFGRIEGDATRFRDVRDGAAVVLERSPDA